MKFKNILNRSLAAVCSAAMLVTSVNLTFATDDSYHEHEFVYEYIDEETHDKSCFDADCDFGIINEFHEFDDEGACICGAVNDIPSEDIEDNIEDDDILFEEHVCDENCEHEPIQKKVTVDDLDHDIKYVDNLDGTHVVTCLCSEQYIPQDDDDMTNITLPCGFETSVEDHTFEDGVCTYCEALDPDSVELVERTISADCENVATGDIITFTATGKIPENAELIVKPLYDDDFIYTQNIIATSDIIPEDAFGSVDMSFDITILVDGCEYQPEEFGEDVVISVQNLGLALNSPDFIPFITHIDALGNASAVDIDFDNTEVFVTDDEVTPDFVDSLQFVTDSFSTYSIGSYIYVYSCGTRAYQIQVYKKSDSLCNVIYHLEDSSVMSSYSPTSQGKAYTEDSGSMNGYKQYRDDSIASSSGLCAFMFYNVLLDYYSSTGSNDLIIASMDGSYHSTGDDTTGSNNIFRRVSNRNWSLTGEVIWDNIVIDADHVTGFGKNTFNGICALHFHANRGTDYIYGEYISCRSMGYASFDGSSNQIFRSIGESCFEGANIRCMDFFSNTGNITSLGAKCFYKFNCGRSGTLLSSRDDSYKQLFANEYRGAYYEAFAALINDSLLRNVTTIPDYAFSRFCSVKWDQYNGDTVEIHIPDSCTSIGNYAFDCFGGNAYGSNDVKNITLVGGKNVTSVGTKAFSQYGSGVGWTIDLSDVPASSALYNRDYWTNDKRKAIKPTDLPKSWNAGDGFNTTADNPPASYTSDKWILPNNNSTIGYNDTDTSVYHKDPADASNSVIVTLDYTNGTDSSDGMTLTVSGSGYMMNWKDHWYDNRGTEYVDPCNPWGAFICKYANALGITNSTPITLVVEDGVKGLGANCFVTGCTKYAAGGKPYFVYYGLNNLPDSLEYIHYRTFPSMYTVSNIKTDADIALMTIPSDIHNNYRYYDYGINAYAYCFNPQYIESVNYSINCYDTDGVLLNSTDKALSGLYYDTVNHKALTRFPPYASISYYLPYDSGTSDLLSIPGYLPNFAIPATAPAYFDNTDLANLEFAYEYVECSDAPLRFVNYDDTLIKTVADYKTGDHIDVPTVTDDMYPEAEGRSYFFVGWMDNSGKVWGSTDLAHLSMFTEAQTLKAVYSNDYSSKQFTISFVDANGNPIEGYEDKSYSYNEVIDIPALPDGYFGTDKHYYVYTGWSPTVNTRCIESVTYTGLSALDDASIPAISYTNPVYYDGASYNGYGNSNRISFVQNQVRYGVDTTSSSYRNYLFGQGWYSPIVALTESQAEALNIQGSRRSYTSSHTTAYGVSTFDDGYYDLLDAMTDDHIDTLNNQYRITSFKDVDSGDVYTAYDFFNMQAYQLSGHTYTPIVELYTSAMSGADGSHWIVIANDIYSPSSSATSTTRSTAWSCDSAAWVQYYPNTYGLKDVIAVYSNLNAYDSYILPYNICNKFHYQPNDTFILGDDSVPERSNTYYRVLAYGSKYASQRLVESYRSVPVYNYDKGLVSAHYVDGSGNPYAANMRINFVLLNKSGNLTEYGFTDGVTSSSYISTAFIDGKFNYLSSYCNNGCSSYSDHVNNCHDGYAFTGRYILASSVPNDYLTNLDFNNIDIIQYFSPGDVINLTDSSGKLKPQFKNGFIYVIPEYTKLSADNLLTVTYLDWDGSVISELKCKPGTALSTLPAVDTSGLTRPETIAYGKATKYTFKGFKYAGYNIPPYSVQSDLTCIAMYSADTVNVNYTVSLPASINVGSLTLVNNKYQATGDYEISASGNFSSDYRLVVEPSLDTFTLSNGSNNLTANISQTKRSFSRSDIDTEAKITGNVLINSTDLPNPGSYTGEIKFLFEIKPNN